MRTPNEARPSGPGGKPGEMKSMTEVSNKVIKNGYTESFQVTGNGLTSQATNKNYRPEDINVIDFFRFEGESDPADNAILYVIETADGHKGALIDAYGTYSDGRVNAFMQQVESIHKKVEKGNGPGQS